MSETPDKPPEESTGRKRAKGATQEPPVAAAEKEPAVGESPPNLIEFASSRSGGRGKNKAADGTAKKATQADRGTAQAGAGATESRDEALQASSGSAHAWRVPDSVQERFIQIGNKFHFPDGTEAFTHHGNRLTTRSENAIVIQSMVAIAHEAGRGEITVGGTEFFRKEAWFSASLVGLTVRGYEPTEFERERLARALAARRGAPPSEARPEAPPTQAAREAAASRSPDSALIVGRLVDHGPAPYAHDPKQAMSYFVRIETERGDRELWGVDLERAFRQSLSTPGIGDEIGVRAVGKAAVTVLAAKRDAQGREIGREEIETHRNEWLVERTSFLDERRKLADVVRDPSINASDAIKRHPELEGSYLQLQMGHALAERQYASHEHREQFVEHLRAHLARRIEHGQPLEPVHLRAAEERTPTPRSPDRDYNPTR
ncbi:MAG: LPD7 domain-containing protein [Gammaproteobacteria bacterium]